MQHPRGMKRLGHLTSASECFLSCAVADENHPFQQPMGCTSRAEAPFPTPTPLTQPASVPERKKKSQANLFLSPLFVTDRLFLDESDDEYVWPKVTLLLKTPKVKLLLKTPVPAAPPAPPATGALVPMERVEEPLSRKRTLDAARAEFLSVRLEPVCDLFCYEEPLTPCSDTRVASPPSVDAAALLCPSDSSVPASIQATKELQRDINTGYWHSDLFFPGQQGKRIKDPLDHASVRAARSYVCYSSRCKKGDCCSQLEELDVMELRQRYNNGSATSSCSDVDQLSAVVRAARDNSVAGGYRTVTVSFKNGSPVDVCLPAFGLLAGYTGAALKHAMSGTAARASTAAVVPLATSKREREATALSMCRSYIHNVLCAAHEQQPVASLGSSTGRETVVNKQTWQTKVDNMNTWFRAPPRNTEPPNVSLSQFKQLWNEETQLKERKASSHSKCDVCANIDSAFNRLTGNNTADAIAKRQLLRESRVLHEKNHLGERSEMDYACLRAVVDPYSVWVIMADAATQRNFALPRILKTRAKELQCLPFFGLKLMATYAPGFGFTPFLVHDSMYAGANLMWTVVWMTINAMHAHYGFLPDELHLQLDNTSGENKNETMVAIAAWLTAAGYFKRVRVFFLMVGHTHIIIDQIFGVITKYIKGRELLDVPALRNAIDATLVKNPQYEAKQTRLLHALFDFKAFAKEGLGGLHPMKYLCGHPTYWDEVGGWNGFHDFLFEENTVRMRQSSQAPYAEAAATLKKHPPPEDVVPALAQSKTREKWAKDAKGTKDVQHTIGLCLRHASTVTDAEALAVKQTWDKVFLEIPERVEDLRVDLVPAFLRPQRNVPVIEHVIQNLGTGPELDELIALNANWGFKIFDRMQNPAINPMVTSNQTPAALAGRLERFRRLTRGTTLPTVCNTSPVFPGDWLLVRLEPQASIRLAHVVRLQGSVSPNNESVSLIANMFEHTPNAEHSTGLLGTFKEALVANTARSANSNRRKDSVKLARGNIILYNVRPMGKGASRRLRVSTLRVLAETVAEEEYVLPEILPKSHRNDDQLSEDEDASGDEESADEDAGPARVGPCSAPRSARFRSVSRRRKARSDDGSEDESEDEESAKDSSEDEESEEGESELGNSGDLEGDAEGEGEGEDGDDTGEATRARREFALNHLKSDTFAFIDLSGAEEMEQQKYPCALAFVSNVRREMFPDEEGVPSGTVVLGTVGWYTRSGWNTKGFPQTKNAGYRKHILVTPGESGKSVERWHVEDNFVLTDCVVPICLPSNQPNQKVAFDPAFMKQLASTCEDVGVVNK